MKKPTIEQRRRAARDTATEHERAVNQIKADLRNIVMSCDVLYNHDLERVTDDHSAAMDVLLKERERLRGLLALAGELETWGADVPLVLK